MATGASTADSASAAGTRGANPAATRIAMVFQPKSDSAPGGPPTEPKPEEKTTPAKPGDGPPPAGAVPPKPGEKPTTRAEALEQALGMGSDEEGGLIGPVKIEWVEGLDALILSGHKRDVARVRRLIEELEKLSIDRQPNIEVVRLRHVGCQALDTLVYQLYQEILSPRQGPVAIRALVKPNALLLIGRPESIEILKQLIAKLDQPVAPETQFEVFKLKHMSAVDAEQTIRTFFVDRLGGNDGGRGVGRCRFGRRPPSPGRGPPRPGWARGSTWSPCFARTP